MFKNHGESLQNGPASLCEVTILAGESAGTTANCITSTNSMFTFRLSSNQIFSIRITLRNAGLSTVSQMNISKWMLWYVMFFIECVLGTHDVQSIGVSSAAPNTVSLSASFSEISAAEGVMFVLLFTEESGSVSFTDSVYLVLERAQSNQFM